VFVLCMKRCIGFVVGMRHPSFRNRCPSFTPQPREPASLRMAISPRFFGDLLFSHRRALPRLWHGEHHQRFAREHKLRTSRLSLSAPTHPNLEQELT
jgi:hypothetical protein